MKATTTHLVVAALLCAIALGAYGAWYSTVAGKSAAVADIENQIAAKTETASRVNTARAELAELADAETLVRGYFVSENGAPTFIDDLEARGRARGSVVTVSAVTTTGTSPHTALALSVVVKGSFDAVMRTVGALEYAPYAITVSSMALIQDGKNAWHADLKMTVGSVAEVTIPVLKPVSRTSGTSTNFTTATAP